MAGFVRQLTAQSGFRRQDSWLVSAIVVTLLAAAVYLVGIAAVPVTDRDEPRFAQASRQMAEAESLGGWIVPRVGDKIRLKKPPLIYWAQAPIVLAATGGDPRQDAIWMYRLPSAIAAWLAGLATLWLGRRMFGGNVGLLAAATLVICPVLVTDAHMARADEVLLFATTLAMCALWICWKSHRVAPAARGGLPFAPTVALWFFIALGMLAKGPITPFVVGSCAFVCAAARRDWRFLWRLRPFTGIAVLACIAVPWVVLAAREVGWETLREAFRAEVLDRAKEGAEGHGAPPGYYLITLVAFFFPGSLLTALAFGRLFLRAFAATTAEHAGFFSRFRTRLFSARGRDAEIFLLGWAVPTWLAFEIVVTKFPHYILPIYPALALFTARCVLGGLRAMPKKLDGLDRFGFGAWMVVGACLALGGPAIAIFLASRGWVASAEGAWPAFQADSVVRVVLASCATLGAVVLIVLAWRDAVRDRFVRAMTLAIPATVLAEVAIFGAWIPSFRWVFNTPRIVGIVAEHSGKTPSDDDFPRIGGVGYQEDSLLWTTRDRLDRLGDRVTDANRAQVLAWIEANPGAYLLIPRTEIEDLADGARALEPVGELDGFNYSDGDPVAHAILRVKPPENP
jgi:4-amino-4-deoxy-L-arabinose transferase-like glycosyltransferase